METVRMANRREVEVTVKKQVIDTFEVPCIDFTNGLKAEITDGNGGFYLNGVLLMGLRPNRANRGTKVIELFTPSGYIIKIAVSELLVTSGDIPTTAKLIETVDAPYKGS